MSFWKRMNIKWDEDSISTWSSPRKTLYILFPLLVYFLVHDMVEVVLWGSLNIFMGRASESVVAFLNRNGYSVRGIIYGIAILAGVAAIGQGVLAELSDKPRLPRGARRYGKAKAGKKETRKEELEKEKIEKEGLEKRQPEEGKGKVFGAGVDKQVTEYMFLAALAFLSSFGLNLLFGFVGFTENSQAFTKTAQAQFGVNFFIGLVLYGVLSPIAEEAVFRGMIYNRMKRSFRYEIALVVSALLFGCYHGNLVQAVYGTILGLLMAYMYELYHSFAAPVLFHAVANVSIYVLTYYHGMEKMDRNIGLMTSVVSLLGAAGCFFYIRKYIKTKHNKAK